MEMSASIYTPISQRLDPRGRMQDSYQVWDINFPPNAIQLYRNTHNAIRLSVAHFTDWLMHPVVPNSLLYEYAV